MQTNTQEDQMLSACLRAGWEAERESIRKDLIERKFNPRSVERVIDNFINSMVFAKLPCTTTRGIAASAREHFVRQRAKGHNAKN